MPESPVRSLDVSFNWPMTARGCGDALEALKDKIRQMNRIEIDRLRPGDTSGNPDDFGNGIGTFEGGHWRYLDHSDPPPFDCEAGIIARLIALHPTLHTVVSPPAKPQ